MPANTPPELDPILERVAQNIVDTVKSIPTLYAAEGGYYFKDYVVDRPHPQTKLSVEELRVLVIQGLGEGKEESSSTCSLTSSEYFTLRADAIVSERGSESIDRKLNLIRADLLKIMMKDRQRGGLAITTEFAYAEIVDEVSDLSQGRVDLVFIVTLQQSWLDPTAF